MQGKSYLADTVNEMKMWTVSKRNISTEKELAGRLSSFYVAQTVWWSRFSGCSKNNFR